MASPMPQLPAPCPRSDEEIREKLREYADPRYEAISGKAYLSGLRDSLRWVLGELAEAPVTGRRSDGRPGRWRISSEADSAEEGMRGVSFEGRRWRQEHGLRYLTGCENTLFWAAGGEGI